MTSLTRGPLPARVYWTRRALVLGVVLGLGAGVVQLVQLAGGGDPPPTDRAAQVAADTTSSAEPEPSPSDEQAAYPSGKRREKDRDRQQHKDEEPVLATPEGPCSDSDIAVTPTARRTVAGSPVKFLLELRTISSPACTWQVSSESVTVKITSGKDDIWSSQDCPRSIPRESVVVRDNVSTKVAVTWSARRSDEECSRLTEWALPGWYHINAAALAGEPSDLQFELTAPKPEVVTRTVEPDPTKGEKDNKRDDRRRG